MDASRKICPHCGTQGFMPPDLPREVIAVIACQKCRGLAVLFRGNLIALKKEVLESGTFDERKEHLAEVVAQFLELGLLDPVDFGGIPGGNESTGNDTVEGPSITELEIQKFLQVELPAIDNPKYFRQIFG